jgi:uncharacterized membrane protein YqjE
MIADMIALRRACRALFSQAALHGQLARIEWAEEKNRLLKIFVAALLGFACLLCIMLLTAVLALMFSWATEYRIPVLILMIVLYGIGAGMAWKRLQYLIAKGDQTFAATLDELAADANLFKSHL